MRGGSEIFTVNGIDDALKRLKAERDENHCRKPWTPSEWVEIGKRLEVLEKKLAAERMAATQPKKGEQVGFIGTGNFPEPEKGRASDKVAEALGVSGKTYEKAKQVVEAADDTTLPEPVREVARSDGHDGFFFGVFAGAFFVAGFFCNSAIFAAASNRSLAHVLVGLPANAAAASIVVRSAAVNMI